MTWIQVDNTHAYNLEHGKRLEVHWEQCAPCTPWQLRLSDVCCDGYFIILEDCKPAPVMREFDCIMRAIQCGKPFVGSE